jgi:hypothetical protein
VHRRRALGLAAFLLAAAGLMAYALTYRTPAGAKPNTLFASSQQTFDLTRTVATTGFVLHTLEFRTDGGDVEADWYDSSLASTGTRSGVYAVLMIDGDEIASALTGSYLGNPDKGPATLSWAGPLPAGEHRFVIELQRPTAPVDVPYVQPGQVGVDSLVITQEPGGS